MIQSIELIEIINKRDTGLIVTFHKMTYRPGRCDRTQPENADSVMGDDSKIYARMRLQIYFSHRFDYIFPLLIPVTVAAAAVTANKFKSPINLVRQRHSHMLMQIDDMRMHMILLM